MQSISEESDAVGTPRPFAPASLSLGRGFDPHRPYRPSVSVVVSRLEHHDIVAVDQIDEPMLLINSARPTPGKNMAKWLRLSYSFRWVTCRGFEQTVETLEHCLIVGLPMAVVLPAQRSENQTH